MSCGVQAETTAPQSTVNLSVHYFTLLYHATSHCTEPFRIFSCPSQLCRHQPIIHCIIYQRSLSRSVSNPVHKLNKQVHLFLPPSTPSVTFIHESTYIILVLHRLVRLIFFPFHILVSASVTPLPTIYNHVILQSKFCRSASLHEQMHCTME